ncbi:BgTH12-07300 [Blumeria graminis f. sp. triticale]|uniref:BgtA-21095 n=3 Tax=Blumeria graminis TaxID=34373 RepID=A0A9X9MPL9_BLUGR|nr:hypothetical protein BGT96224_A21095 [Blumeria graminis f. sp. tritici 96224]CAD6506374.1 BgTH12-07300 [Blumeria graminis f. sp. triticale]VDB95162.1 BgtA-21095 [Blumeria graminis f. sp. tritici]
MALQCSKLSSFTESPTTPQTLQSKFQAPIDQRNAESRARLARGNRSLSVPISSITPPPSSHEDLVQSITLESPVLSSSSSNSLKRKRSLLKSRPMRKSRQSTTVEELWDTLDRVFYENQKLEIIAKESRMSAAHHKLQTHFLQIESREVFNRLEAENFMFQREVEFIRHNPQNTAQIDYNHRLRGQCDSLLAEKTVIQRELQKAKRIIRIQERKLTNARQEIALLQDRIRQNRRHINEMRRSGGPLHQFTTPKNFVSAPRNLKTNRNHLSPHQFQNHYIHSSHVNQENFNALLLAGSILNKENESNGSTFSYACRSTSSSPISCSLVRPILSSFSTCSSVYPEPPLALLSPVQFTPENETCNDLRSKSFHEITDGYHHNSRDSTISASDAEELVRSCLTGHDANVLVNQAFTTPMNINHCRQSDRDNDIVNEESVPFHRHHDMRGERGIVQPQTHSTMLRRKQDEGQFKLEKKEKSKIVREKRS